MTTKINHTLTRPASLKEWQERILQVSQIRAKSTHCGMAYQAQPTDVFIAPYDKCGTTWLQQIVHSLRTRGDMNFEDISQVIPWLEEAYLLKQDLCAPQRGGFRAFKSHLSYQAIPKGGRYIVSCRDPKDALVSLYNFLDGWFWQTGSVSITEFAETVYLNHQGDRWEESYWGHLVSWWEQRDNPNVLLLCYETMKVDLSATIKTIAHFLRLNMEQDLLALAIQQASLDFMLTHRSKFSQQLVQAERAKIGMTPPSDKVATVNTGRVGDYRAQLPASIAAEMDLIWQETVAARVGLSSYQALRETLA